MSILKKTNLRNNEGMTLVEILIATAIVTISAFAILQIIRVAQSSVTSVSRQLTYDVVKMNVGNILNYPSDCISAINNGSGGQFNYDGTLKELSQIAVGGDVIVQADTAVDGVLFKKITVRPVAGVNPVLTTTQRYYLAELVITAEKQGDITGARTLSNENNPFRFYVITDTANNMMSCSASGFLDALPTCTKTGLPFKATKTDNDVDYDIFAIGSSLNYNNGTLPGSTTAKKVCINVPENSTDSLKCKAGQRIQSISFANYGLNTGSCGTGSAPPTVAKGSCASVDIEAYITSRCYGRDTCALMATNSEYGDPCVGVGKSLSVVAVCEDEGMVDIPPGWDENSLTNPTPTPSPTPTGVAAYCVTKHGATAGSVAVCVANTPCYWEQ